MDLDKTRIQTETSIPNELLKPYGSGDVALCLVDTLVVTDVTLEEEASTLRRIDFVLMPLMFMSYALQYMDKACLTGAAMFGILTDLDLVKFENVHGKLAVNLSRYANASLIFYWGALVGVIPASYLCQKFPISKYIAVIMIIWGGVTVATVGVHTYKGLLIQRFFLGVAEAGITPAFSLVTVMWYRRREQPLRYAVWFSATGIGVLIGTLLLYAIGKIKGDLAPWRYQFMIIGCFTCLWGVVIWVVLPDTPLKARFLTERQKIVAIERIRFEQVGIENKKVKSQQIREAFTDPKTWIYVLLMFCVTLTNGATTGFGSVIVQSFGYSQLKTILLLGGAGATSFLALVTSGAIALHVKNSRSYLGMFSCLPVIAGSAMVWKSNWGQKSTPLWGFYLTSIFSTSIVMVLTLMSANTAGHTKKAVTASLVWASGCISNGIAPLTVLTVEKDGHYPTAWTIIISMMSFSFVLFAVLRFYLVSMNNERDKVSKVSREEAARTAFLDMTDRENYNFRYEY